MSTTEKIEAITDSGLYEKLIHSVLLKINPTYNALIHTGVNAKGEPVISPVDGFNKISNSDPPHFIIAQHTITERRSLRNKWLNESASNASQKGDLIKASALAEEIRDSNPDAIFTVILTTNQRLDSDLIRDVHLKAEELGLMCDIYEQTRIINYLDNTGDGHWIRKQYLGIDAEILSEDLLFEICERSYSLYEEYQYTSNDFIINRSLTDLLYERLKNENCSVLLLVGESGYGKSVISIQLLKRRIDEKKFALFIPAELLNNSISLFEMIHSCLSKCHPSLYLETERELVELIKMNDKLLLIIDDVNRIPDPVGNLKKLISWIKPTQHSMGHLPSFTSHFSVLCPIWPKNYRSLFSDLNLPYWIGIQNIEIFSDEDSKSAIQKIFDILDIPISYALLTKISENLGNDPILIGLFGDILINNRDTDFDIISKNALETFI